MAQLGPLLRDAAKTFASVLSAVLELAGLACLAGAAFLLGGFAALLIVAGLELVLLGLAADRQRV